MGEYLQGSNILKYILWVTLGDSKIFNFLPVATAKNLESGLKEKAVTLALKLKCAMTTFLIKLTTSANPSTSIVISMRLSGDNSILLMLLLF